MCSSLSLYYRTLLFSDLFRESELKLVFSSACRFSYASVFSLAAEVFITLKFFPCQFRMALYMTIFDFSEIW